MNLTTFRLRIQSTTGLASASPGHYEQTLVDGWVNEGITQFLMRTKAVKKTASLALTAGQGDYTIDPNVIAFEDAYIGNSMLKNVDTQDIRRWRLNPSYSPAGSVGCFAYEGQTIMLYPTPVAADVLHMVYVPEPLAPLVGGNDDPSGAGFGFIPNEYHPTIEAYAKWKAGEYANDQPSQNGQVWKQEWEAGVVSTRSLETRKAGVNVRRATPGWRSKAGVGIAPGVDQGY